MQHSRKSLKPEVHVLDAQRILVKNTGIVSADVQTGQNQRTRTKMENRVKNQNNDTQRAAW